MPPAARAVSSVPALSPGSCRARQPRPLLQRGAGALPLSLLPRSRGVCPTIVGDRARTGTAAPRAPQLAPTPHELPRDPPHGRARSAEPRLELTHCLPRRRRRLARGGGAELCTALRVIARIRELRPVIERELSSSALIRSRSDWFCCQTDVYAPVTLPQQPGSDSFLVVAAHHHRQGMPGEVLRMPIPLVDPGSGSPRLTDRAATAARPSRARVSPSTAHRKSCSPVHAVCGYARRDERDRAKAPADGFVSRSRRRASTRSSSSRSAGPRGWTT